ncbi:methyltransferase domain-containing protein [Patescibacteria group bacterium]|nr:methyltransferase domain-containing protein [Patescibacteria group bacterium]
MNIQKFKNFINEHNYLRILKDFIKKILFWISLQKKINKLNKTNTYLKQFYGNNQKVKLNLGCCDKQDRGWINIDIDKKFNPDILDDVTVLSCFKDNCADEIKSAHLIEHLTYEDTLKAFKNWFRVLKKGGILSIECPNLDKCIDMIRSEEDSEKIRLGFVGIFGDPWAIKKYGILHSHKHGWNPKTLRVELKNIGFVDIKEVKIEETYRYCNQKYERDMRILAKK